MSARGETIDSWLEERARSSGESTALIGIDGGTISYAELRARVRSIAGALDALGVARTGRVALAVPPGPENAATFVGLACAASCVPLDPDARVAELGPLFDRVRPSLVVADARSGAAAIEAARERGIEVVELAAGESAERGLAAVAERRGAVATERDAASPADEALVLFTSGTTSQPKIVPLTHANLCAGARNVAASLELGPSDVALNTMPMFHVGGLVDNVLAPLHAGGATLCAPRFTAEVFGRAVREHAPTWWQGVPTMLSEVVSLAEGDPDVAACAELRFVRAVSSALPPDLCAEFEDWFDTVVVEIYGMTEASGVIASSPLSRDARKVGSVGVAFGSEVAVVGPAGDDVATGDRGEVVVRGPGVMHGYEGLAEGQEPAIRHGRLHTGDEGYLDADGFLFLTGRIKELINRGGEKIAPREVEEVLRTHADVDDVAVFAVPHTELGEDVAAAVVVRSGAAFDARALVRFATERLAHYKVPRDVRCVDALPLGSGGKVLRTELARRFAEEAAPSTASPRTADGAAKALGPVAAFVAREWTELLGEDVRAHGDDFFELGGTSLKATSFVARMQSNHGAAVNVSALFDAPTVEEFEAYLRDEHADLVVRLEAGADSGAADMIPRIPAGEPAPLSFAQERLWDLAVLYPDSSVHHIGVAFRVRGPLDVPALERALGAIEERHAVLRSTVRRTDDGPVQAPATHGGPAGAVVDLRDVIEKERPFVADAEVAALVSEPFDLTSSRPWRYRVLVLEDDSHVIGLAFHHFAFDARSRDVLLRELASLYASDGASLPEVDLQFGDFAAWHRARLEGPRGDELRRYWGDVMTPPPEPLVLPADHDRGAASAASSAHLDFEWPSALGARVDDLAQRLDASAYHLLLAAFHVLIFRRTAQKDQLVCAPSLGRSRSEVEHSIGFYNNLVVLRADLSGDPSFTEVVERVRAASLGAFDHEELPHQWLHELPGLERTPLTRALFSLRQDVVHDLELHGLQCETVALRKDAPDFELALHLESNGHELKGYVEYDASRFERATIEALLVEYEALLGEATEDSSRRLLTLAPDPAGKLILTRALDDDPTVEESFVVERATSGGTVGRIAYVVPNQDDLPEPEALRRLCASVPGPATSVVQLAALPRFADGSVDLAALPEPAAARADREHVAPATELERELAKLWAETLWLEGGVGVEDDFFELGGHSLLAVELVGAIERHVGRSLPVEALRRLGTVAEMVRFLESDDAAGVGSSEFESGLDESIYRGLVTHTAAWRGSRLRPDSLIVGLNVRGTRPPLFWCLQGFHELSQLAKHVGADQPVYGMRSGNRVMERSRENSDVLAAHYVEEILEIDPDGPYRLGGNCQAAEIAFSIATRLKARGRDVDVLFMMEKFVPEPYDGRIAFLFGGPSMFCPYRFYRRPERGWRKYYSGGFSEDTLTGKHGQYFREPDVQGLAAHVTAALRDADDPARELVSPREGQRLGPEAYVARIKSPRSLSARPGETLHLDVVVTNASSVTWQPTSTSGVHLDSRWLTRSGDVVQWYDGAAELQVPLAPGASVSLALTVTPPDVPGRYRLELDLVDEGVTWFGDQGSPVRRVSVHVLGPRRAALHGVADRLLGRSSTTTVTSPTAT